MVWINSASPSSSRLACLTRITLVYMFSGMMRALSQAVDVRLVNNAGIELYSYEQLGFVEVSVTGEEAYVALCGSVVANFKTGSVICRQLGLGPPVLAENLYGSSQGSSERMKYFLAESCDGTESSLGECSLNFLEANHDCGVLQVQCLPANASDFDVALVRRSQNSMEGIPLVYLDRQWSPICHGVLNDAVCNQLGLGDEGGWKEVPSWVEVFDNTHREIGFSCSSTTESHLRECQLTAISCCECTGYLSISCLGDDDDSGNGSRRRNSGGYSYFYGFVGVIVVVIIIARRFYIAKTRQTNGRLCTLSGNARTSRVCRPRDATSSSNNGPSIPAAQFTNTQTSFGAEYNTPASFSAFPPPYSAVSSPAYPPVSEPGAQTSALAYPPVSELGAQTSALVYPPVSQPGAPTSALAYPPVSQPGAQTSAHDQQVTAPAVDPNLPTYEQASKADGPR